MRDQHSPKAIYQQLTVAATFMFSRRYFNTSLLNNFLTTLSQSIFQIDEGRRRKASGSRGCWKRFSFIENIFNLKKDGTDFHVFDMIYGWKNYLLFNESSTEKRCDINLLIFTHKSSPWQEKKFPTKKKFSVQGLE